MPIILQPAIIDPVMRRSGFTLVELLVVIGIMAVLAAILFPVLETARQRGRAVACGSNIRNLFLAMSLYEGDYQSFPWGSDILRRDPAPRSRRNDYCYDGPGWWWFDYAYSYLQQVGPKKNTLWCPSRKITEFRLDSNVLHGNYGVNQSVCLNPYEPRSREEFKGKPLGTVDIPQPARTLLIVDSGYCVVSWWHATLSLPELAYLTDDAADLNYVPGLGINSEKSVAPGHEIDAIYGRHPNKTVNIAFVDGHIERLNAEMMLVTRQPDTGRYGNLTPIWRPK